MSAAGGPNGYTLVGQADNSFGLDLLIGSAFADTINGGNDNQQIGDAEDMLTGNGGNDTFQFNVVVNSAAVLTIATTTAAIDREVITLSTDTTDDNNESMTIAYTLNGAAGNIVVNLAGIDVTDAARAGRCGAGPGRRCRGPQRQHLGQRRGPPG